VFTYSSLEVYQLGVLSKPPPRFKKIKKIIQVLYFHFEETSINGHKINTPLPPRKRKKNKVKNRFYWLSGETCEIQKNISRAKEFCSIDLH